MQLQLNWKVLEDISDAINEKQEVALNTLSSAPMIKKEFDEIIGTLATALTDEQFCADKDAAVVHEANLAIDDLMLLSSTFDTSPKNGGHAAVQGVLERLQSIRPKIDAFLNCSIMSQEFKIEQMEGESVRSSETEVEQTSEEKNHVKGTGEDLLVVQHQNGSANTRDAKGKEGKEE